jgi:hypothetical protein
LYLRGDPLRAQPRRFASTSYRAEQQEHTRQMSAAAPLTITKAYTPALRQSASTPTSAPAHFGHNPRHYTPHGAQAQAIRPQAVPMHGSKHGSNPMMHPYQPQVPQQQQPTYYVQRCSQLMPKAFKPNMGTPQACMGTPQACMGPVPAHPSDPMACTSNCNQACSSLILIPCLP